MRHAGRLHASAQAAECRFCGVEQREAVLAGGGDASTVVIPSKGALVAGWVLVVPVDHVLSLAELPNEQREGFALAAGDAERHLRERFGSVVQFEHGPAAQGRLAGCGVDHAHLHLVPIDLDLRSAAVSARLLPPDAEWRHAQWPWTARCRSEADYLFVRDADGSGWMLESPAVPSQLFRRVIARSQGHNKWDWKDAATADESMTTRLCWADDAAHSRVATP